MSTNGTNGTNGTSQPDMSKDEVGWLFVQQYYTTLSKAPSRLHLFYGRKSQFVSGNEAEIADVSVGRSDIQARIAKLDFEDCKFRVSNVDTQSSLEQIVIQVIGEISNKSEDSRKFVQTFVLAEQPSGYFVLNDIFRYIKDEDDEPVEEEAVAAATAAAATTTTTTTEETAAPGEAKAEEKEETEVEVEVEVEAEAGAEAEAETEAAKPDLDADVVDEKLEKLEQLEEVAKEAPAVPAVPAVPAIPAVPTIPAVAVPEPAASAAPKAAEPVSATPASAPASATTPAPELEKAAEEVAEEAEAKVEEPKDPSPTPAVAPAAAVAAPVAAAPTEPEKPKGPPKPMTWASRIAAAAGPVAKAAVPKAAAAAASAASAAAPVPTPAAKAATPAAAGAKAENATSGNKENSEWQTAGSESKRQNRPQSISTPPQDKDSALGYVKYVTDKVDEAALRAQLEKYGPVVYFDINRAKNCAFIEFASPAGYQAAVAANPHVINGENVLVEPRRPKASAYGGSNYNTPRGNIPARGRNGFEGRNGSQNGGRGGFPGQGRGRGGAGGVFRGRGGAQNLAT